MISDRAHWGFWYCFEIWYNSIILYRYEMTSSRLRGGQDKQDRLVSLGDFHLECYNRKKVLFLLRVGHRFLFRLKVHKFGASSCEGRIIAQKGTFPKVPPYRNSMASIRPVFYVSEIPQTSISRSLSFLSYARITYTAKAITFWAKPFYA